MIMYYIQHGNKKLTYKNVYHAFVKEKNIDYSMKYNNCELK